MEHVFVLVGQDLNLDMFRTRDEPFEKNRTVAERSCRFLACFPHTGGKVTGRVNHTHAAAAATESRLYDQRETYACGRRLNVRASRINCVRCSWNYGYPRRLSQAPRRSLVSQLLENGGTRSDKRNPGALTCTRERGGLGQESITRVDRVDAFARG